MNCKWVGRGQYRKTRPKPRGINSPLSPQYKGLNFLITIGEFDIYFHCHLSYCSCSLSGHLRNKDPNKSLALLSLLLSLSSTWHVASSSPIVILALSYKWDTHLFEVLLCSISTLLCSISIEWYMLAAIWWYQCARGEEYGCHFLEKSPLYIIELS